MSKKDNKSINAYLGEREIKLPDNLLLSLYDELVHQFGKEFEAVDFEITIRVTYESQVEETEPLSKFNKSLKTALNYNPKAKKD